ncbi:G-type lectin S-receptor-like serine/threonine-protein kinase At5g35370 [Musa acuminata AAA Group]|uniref:G-type lectin S-receptor-like serine/threonine-protein kinase At5g35370 n=1 Tax=Musa acuminata AAA Group TaxID=214697 RepID=UPI0031E0A993
MASFSSSSAPTILRLFLLLLFSVSAPLLTVAGSVAHEFVYPNFTASYLHFVDNSGVFLSSSAFSAGFHNPGGQSSRYYLSVIHAPSLTVVWTANPAAPVPPSTNLVLAPAGLTLSLPDGSLAWSTPRLAAPVVALQLLSSGEFRLLDAANASLWSSFDHPTDTLLPSQLLPASASLSSAVSDNDPSPGNYRLLITPGDALLRWTVISQNYWSLSTDVRFTKDSNLEVGYMAVNATGLYLLAGDRQTTVFRMISPPPHSSSPDEFRIAKLDPSGKFRILSFDTDFVAPSNDCDLPSVCGSLGLCFPIANNSICRCPASFGASLAGGCSPADGSILANSSCPDEDNSGSVSYISLGSQIDYFGTKFSTPITAGANISACSDLCSRNCSCLGFFYNNSSKSCYILEHQIGSLFIVDNGSGDTSTAGYIKTLSQPSRQPPSSGSQSSARLLVVLLPTTATVLLVISICLVCYAMRRRNKRQTTAEISHEEAGKEDEIAIPGLPTRYTYAELEAATDNFQTRIGSGGFGSVYKGQLQDKSFVAVKKINAVSVQGRREFCTEIAVIGNIHHVNLVRLRGFCAQGQSRLLVYEYMNRFSLDRALFGHSLVLEWRERLQIAVGAARGLAYLHTGCEHKIIHCDVKPENILLHDHNQVKIADFGLAKLMSPEQSGLFTTMRGTRGYLAPEWLTNSAITDKADVYSFGMVLLEIVRGRKNRKEQLWTEPSGSCGSSTPETYFPMVALEMHGRGTYEDLADPRLEGRVNEPELERVVKVALCCLHREPAQRPSMTKVAAMLEGTMLVPHPRLESLDFLRSYGRGFGDPNARRGCGPNSTSAGSGSSASPLLSYVSSQEVSGPR